MTPNLSPACNMSLTQYVPLVEWPTTIVCDTFQEIASGSVMSGICLSVCWLHRERAHAGRSPWVHDHGAVQKCESERCRVLKLKGKMPTKWQITCSSWPKCNGPWWGHSRCPFKANQQRNEYSGRAWAGKRNVAGERGKNLNLEHCKRHNGYSSESETAWRNTSCSGGASSAQLLDHVLQRLVLQWEKLQAKRRAERLLPAAEFSSKKNGFQLLCINCYFPNVRHWHHVCVSFSI